MKQLIKNHIANTLTMVNMSCGVLAIIATINYNLTMAIVLIVLAGIADRFDGYAARKTGTQSDIGVELDSLADLLSFGVAPVIMAYVFKFKDLSYNLHNIGIIITILYVCAGGYRLARYNCIKLVEGYFLGLPITICGVIMATVMIFQAYVKYPLVMILMVFLAYMMVSKIKIKKR